MQLENIHFAGGESSFKFQDRNAVQDSGHVLPSAHAQLMSSHSELPDCESCLHYPVSPKFCGFCLTPSSLPCRTPPCPPGHTASAQAHSSISHVTISSLACKLFFLCNSSNLASKCPPHCKVIFSKATLMLSVRGLVTTSVHSLQDQSTLLKLH